MTKPKAAVVQTSSSPIPGITEEQYKMFVKHFSGNNNVNDSETKPEANMAGSFDLNYEWIVDSGAT